VRFQLKQRTTSARSTHLGYSWECALEGDNVCTKFQADGTFPSKVIRVSPNFEIGSRDPKPRPLWTWNVEFV